MGLFGQSPLDTDIEKATSETNTNENWSLIINVCDKVSNSSHTAKDCLKAIMKRMNHPDPHIVMQAITLLDACSNNCGRPFHLEIASREFENEFKRLLTKTQPQVVAKMCEVLKKWAENDYKTDPALNLIPSLYAKLREDGYYANSSSKPAKQSSKLSALKDPNVVSSQQEEDDIAKAIELSLKEANSPKHQPSGTSGRAEQKSTAYPSLYPSFPGAGSIGSIASSGGNSANSNTQQAEPRKVRALYDFEAAEENELTFFSGEIIHVLDDSDSNWWKGYNQRGEGLFPSNFVTADLSVEPERLDINQQGKSKKSVQFEDDAKEMQQKTEAAAAAASNQKIEIEEYKIDRLLHLLHEANPEDPAQDSGEMLQLEQEVHRMGPLIDAELERVDRKHAQLTQLSSDLVDAINLYHSLMRDDRAALMNGTLMPGMANANMPVPMPNVGYAGMHAHQQQMTFSPESYHANLSNFHSQQMQMPPNYGGPPMAAYTNAAQIAATTTPTPNTSIATAAPTVAGPYPVGMSVNAATATQQQPQMQMAIPPQFQNGHMNPSSMHDPATGLVHQPNFQDNRQVFNHLQLVGQPQQQPQPLPPPQPVSASQRVPMPTPQQNPHFMPQPQQQQQQQQQQPMVYGQPPSLQQYPQNYMSAAVVGAVPTTMIPSHSQQQPQPQQTANNQPSIEQFNQLQQQMAAMAMGISPAINQNIMAQNEPKNNIPIYQQQQ